MFFNGTKVYNKRPRKFNNGGYVVQNKNMSNRQIHHDSIKAIVMPNELIIPVKYAKLVSHFLKSKKIRLPNM